MHIDARIFQRVLGIINLVIMQNRFLMVRMPPPKSVFRPTAMLCSADIDELSEAFTLAFSALNRSAEACFREAAFALRRASFAVTAPRGSKLKASVLDAHLFARRVCSSSGNVR